MMLTPFERTTRVCIYTSQPQDWLVQLLNTTLYVVGAVNDCEEAKRFQADLIIVDADVFERKNLTASLGHSVLVLVADEAQAESLIHAGAVDYITPTTRPSIILNRVRILAHHQSLQAKLQFEDFILTNMNDVLIALDSDQHVLYWNGFAEALYGKTTEQMLGKPLSDAYTYQFPTPEDEAYATESFAASGMWRGETLQLTHDGRMLIVDNQAHTLKGMDGQPEGWVLVIHDITERKRVELAEREQRLMAEALRDTAAALTRTLDPQSVMNLILENVGRVVPHETANIMTIEGGVARIAFSRGYNDELAPLRREAMLPVNIPAFQEMMDTGQSILIADTHTDERWHTTEKFNWVRSYVATPIRAYDHVIGFLNLDSDKPNAFSAIDGERLRAFADQAAIAIENAQLYDAIYRDASEMRALHRATAFLFTTNLFTSESVQDVAVQIAQTVVNEFGKVDCGVILITPNGQRLVREARAGEYGMHSDAELTLDGPGLVSEAIRTGSMIYAPNVSEHPQYVETDSRTCSELVVPLRTMKGIIGVLDLQSAEFDAFDTHDQRVLQAFAERAAAAIENMRLYSEIQRRVNERTSELNRVKERAEAILNHSSDAILLLRDDGRIQQTNNAFNEMFGYEPDEAFGKTFESIAGPYYAELLRLSLREVIEEKHAVRIEITATNRENAAIDADVVMSPIITQEQVTSVVCSLRDISQRKRMEFELRDALEKERDLNELKTSFIARASHEFRTPLAVISTAGDLLKNYSHRLSDEQRSEKVTRIHSEIRNITVMLDDLLMLSKTEEVGHRDFQPVVLDLEALCRTLIDEIAVGSGVEHRFEFLTSGDCSHISVDPKLLRRAVLNLLSNGVKYSAPGSVVQLNLSCDWNQTIIVVQDSGIGIPEEDQKGLFQAFHRGRNVEHIAGTGLGLAIVKQSVELHGGEVSFSSQVGIGSAFTLTIPKLAIKEEMA